jgi:hypothetical protein
LLTSAEQLRTRSGTWLPAEQETVEAAIWEAVRLHLSESDLSELVRGTRRMDEPAGLALAEHVLERVRQSSEVQPAAHRPVIRSLNQE